MFFVKKKQHLLLYHLLQLCTSFCHAVENGASRLTCHGSWLTWAGVCTAKVAVVIGSEEPAGVLKEAKAMPPDHAR
jgi:hypothetical protein